MHGGVIQHHRQKAYDEGFAAGAAYGRRLQKMNDELKPLVGFGFGVLIAEIVCITLHAMGWLP